MLVSVVSLCVAFEMRYGCMSYGIRLRRRLALCASRIWKEKASYYVLVGMLLVGTDITAYSTASTGPMDVECL